MRSIKIIYDFIKTYEILIKLFFLDSFIINKSYFKNKKRYTRFKRLFLLILKKYNQELYHVIYIILSSNNIFIKRLKKRILTLLTMLFFLIKQTNNF